MGLDGIEGAEGVDERGTGVHGHSNTEGFGDFLFASASFEGGAGVEGNATVAASDHGHGNGDQLAHFFAEQRVFEVRGGESLVALERVGSEFGEIGNGYGSSAWY